MVFKIINITSMAGWCTIKISNASMFITIGAINKYPKALVFGISSKRPNEISKTFTNARKPVENSNPAKAAALAVWAGGGGIKCKKYSAPNTINTIPNK